MASFDPYHKWLGIPLGEQPANHYRLLGIGDFESDADVIETAAERQTLLLRTFQTGPNAELAERLLNEISAARVCLLDGKSKARYDQQLRAAQQPVPEDDPLAFTTEELAAVPSKSATRSRQRSRGGKPVWKEPWAIPAGAGGIVVLLLLLMMLFGSGEEPQEPANQSTSTTQDSQQKTQPTASKETLPAKAATPPLAVAPFDAAEAKAHQQAWSKYLGVPVEYTNSIGMKFMLIPPGEFQMGAIEGESGDLKNRAAEATRTPSHSVRISKPFYLGKYEVTQSEYKKCTEPDSEIKAGTSESRLPKKSISWHDADSFSTLMMLTEKKNGNVLLGSTPHYRLPTEAEWEYAARAGTETDHFAGNTQEIVADYEWNIKNAARADKPVGEKKASPWGLHDLGGNVYEWCLNWGSYSYYNGEFTIDPTGPSQSTGRKIIRSSSTHYDPFPLWHINTLPPSAVDVRIGFRVALEIPVRAQPNTIAAETKSLPPSLKQGLIAYYPFNGNANDESGNGHHGTSMGGETFVADRHGNSNQAFNSGSNNSFISVPDHNDLDLGNAAGKEMTISLWFNAASGEFLCKQLRPGSDISSRNIDYRLRVFANKPALHVFNWGTGPSSKHGGSSFSWSSVAVPDTGDGWKHLVVTYSQTVPGSKSLFFDGGLVYLAPIDRKSHASNLPLKIGPLNGSLDDVRIYNRALSAAEVKTLYEYEKP